MQLKPQFVIVALIVALSCGWVEQVGAASYSFTKIADNQTASPFPVPEGFAKFGRGVNMGIGIGPAISGSAVTFFGASSNNAHSGIFRGSGGPLTLIANPADTDLGDPVPAISGNTVAFVQGRTGVFSGSGGPLTPVALNGDAAPWGTFSGFGDPVMSGTTVAFLGVNTIGPLQHGIFSKSNGTLTTIAKSGDAAPIGTFDQFSAPAISGSKVAFRGMYFISQGIFAGSGGPLTTIAKAGDAAPTGTFDANGFGSPSISGIKVAFDAAFGSGQRGIFIGQGGPLTTVSRTGDSAPMGTFTSFGSPAINGSSVTFGAAYGSNMEGIFSWSGDPLSTIIKTGDSLFGSVVADLSFDRLGLDPSGSGRLAFNYSLADGRFGVALAERLPFADYNGNNIVDAADYTIWRDTLGSTTDLRANGDNTGASAGVIDQADYFVWKSNFDHAGSGSAASAAIPEPATLVLLLLATTVAAVRNAGRRVKTR